MESQLPGSDVFQAAHACRGNESSLLSHRVWERYGRPARAPAATRRQAGRI